MSATSKAIDRFFLYFIMRLFAVYIQHACLFFVTTWVTNKRKKLDEKENTQHPPVALDVLENTMNFESMPEKAKAMIPPPLAAVYVPANIEFKTPGYFEKNKVSPDGKKVLSKGSRIRPWDDYYNWAGLIIGGLIDLIACVYFVVEIMQKRDEVNDNFYKE